MNERAIHCLIRCLYPWQLSLQTKMACYICPCKTDFTVLREPLYVSFCFPSSANGIFVHLWCEVITSSKERYNPSRNKHTLRHPPHPERLTSTPVPLAHDYMIQGARIVISCPLRFHSRTAWFPRRFNTHNSLLFTNWQIYRTLGPQIDRARWRSEGGGGGGEEGRGTSTCSYNNHCRLCLLPAAKIHKIGQNTAEYDELMEM